MSCQRDHGTATLGKRVLKTQRADCVCRGSQRLGCTHFSISPRFVNSRSTHAPGLKSGNMCVCTPA